VSGSSRITPPGLFWYLGEVIAIEFACDLRYISCFVIPFMEFMPVLMFKPASLSELVVLFFGDII